MNTITIKIIIVITLWSFLCYQIENLPEFDSPLYKPTISTTIIVTIITTIYSLRLTIILLSIINFYLLW